MKSPTLHRCPSCGRNTLTHGHLCEQISKEKTSLCRRCNCALENFRHYCNTKNRRISYICGRCGRAAACADDVCIPIKF